MSSKTILNGQLQQEIDKGNVDTWQEVGGRICTPQEKEDLLFANIICKHLKSIVYYKSVPIEILAKLLVNYFYFSPCVTQSHSRCSSHVLPPLLPALSMAVPVMLELKA